MEDHSQRLDLSQDGARLTATLCDEDWTCVDSDLAGVVTDPKVEADWTVDGNAHSLGADLEPGGNSFVGKVGSDTGHWEIRGERVD